MKQIQGRLKKHREGKELLLIIIKQVSKHLFFRAVKPFRSKKFHKIFVFCFYFKLTLQSFYLHSY